MRSTTLVLSSLFAFASLSHADKSAVNLLWTDNGFVNKPMADSGGSALPVGSVIQIGYFLGVDPNKDPGTYTAGDWASFTPLTGDGSPNAIAYPTAVGDGGAPDGYFSIGVTFDTTTDAGIPLVEVHLGIRFFNASTVAAATNSTIVSVNSTEWILPTPVVSTPMNPNPPFPAEADMDFADFTGGAGLDWIGAEFRTDQVPGMTVPDLVLTDVSLTGPTSLQISWSGGDGTNNVETSTNGTTWTPAALNQASPATITVDTSSPSALLVRVVEP